MPETVATTADNGALTVRFKCGCTANDTSTLDNAFALKACDEEHFKLFA